MSVDKIAGRAYNAGIRQALVDAGLTKEAAGFMDDLSDSAGNLYEGAIDATEGMIGGADRALKDWGVQDTTWGQNMRNQAAVAGANPLRGSYLTGQRANMGLFRQGEAEKQREAMQQAHAQQLQDQIDWTTPDPAAMAHAKERYRQDQMAASVARMRAGVASASLARQQALADRVSSMFSEGEQELQGRLAGEWQTAESKRVARADAARAIALQSEQARLSEEHSGNTAAAYDAYMKANAGATGRMRAEEEQAGLEAADERLRAQWQAQQDWNAPAVAEAARLRAQAEGEAAQYEFNLPAMMARGEHEQEQQAYLDREQQMMADYVAQQAANEGPQAARDAALQRLGGFKPQTPEEAAALIQQARALGIPLEQYAHQIPEELAMQVPVIGAGGETLNAPGAGWMRWLKSLGAPDLAAPGPRFRQ